METYQIIIRGRVQGVGFRYFTLNKANKYGIKGTVENLYESGDVKIVCQGRNLEQFIKEISKGPPLSHIVNLKIKKFDGNEFHSFRIT